MLNFVRRKTIQKQTCPALVFRKAAISLAVTCVHFKTSCDVTLELLSVRHNKVVLY